MSNAASPVPVESALKSRLLDQPASTLSAESVLEELRPQLTELDRFLRGQVSAFEPEIREMADYCIETGGKRIRPSLVFLSGWREPPEVASDLIRVAAVVELVHLATLVHDDMLDGAEVRRGRRTAFREYGPVAAVLLGDALFAHALHLAAQFPTTEVCQAVSASTRRVCAGEVVQTLRRGTTDFSIAEYRRVIDLKTAELFRVSCRLGAALAGYAPGFVEAAGRFGRHLGIAYQIYDDLADYFGEEKRIGKTLGTDLASGKVTLPLLLLLERLDGDEKRILLEVIQGQRVPNLAVHLRQMAQHGIFETVVESMDAEIAAAERVLGPWHELAPSAKLTGLGRLLRGQVFALRDR